MAKAAAKKTDATADPDKLVRQQAGTYRTGDDRFEVREADSSWFLVDTQQANEFGQELIQGPFATLKAVRQALPDARAAKAAPRSKPKPARRTKSAPKPPPPPPRSWIDELPGAEGASVRKLIGALEARGITDAEALVRRDREGLMPAIATRLIESRLDALVGELEDDQQEAARELVRRVADILTAEGSKATSPLPGWTLVEVGPEPEPTNRRIDLRA